MRNILDVMEAMKALLPSDVLAQHANAFRSQEQSVLFSAPELLGLRWECLQELALDICGDVPTTDWQIAVAAEFSGMSVEAMQKIVSDYHAEVAAKVAKASVAEVAAAFGVDPKTLKG